MKTFFLILACILIYGCNSFGQGNKVGEKQGSEFVIKEDITSIRDLFKSRLVAQNIITQLVDYVIVSGVNTEDNNSTYYLLVARSENEETKIALELGLNGNDFILLRANASNATTVTCTGCSVGCDPLKLGNSYFCSSGCGSNCTKSVTTTFSK